MATSTLQRGSCDYHGLGIRKPSITLFVLLFTHAQKVDQKIGMTAGWNDCETGVTSVEAAIEKKKKKIEIIGTVLKSIIDWFE